MLNKTEKIIRLEEINKEIKKIYQIIAKLKEEKDMIKESLNDVTLDDLEPLEIDDLIVGKWVFGVDYDGNVYIHMIKEIIIDLEHWKDYDYDFKAFEDEEGGRYGLCGRFKLKEIVR
jgi:hypothetical protein